MTLTLAIAVPIVIIIFCISAGAELQSLSQNNEKTTASPKPTNIPQDDYLKDPSLWKDENKKTTQKIVNAMNEFSTNHQNYREIKLSAKNYLLGQKSIKFHTLEGNIVFYNLNVSESYDTIFSQKHETFIGCDLSGTTMVQVSLETDITITGEIITEFSAEETVKQGIIIVQFKNGTLKKHLMASPNASDSGTTNSTFPKITYDLSVQVITNSQSRRLDYKQIEAFLNELESSLGAFLNAQLDEEIIKRNISFLSSYSTLVKMRYDEQKITNRTNYLYVIPKLRVVSEVITIEGIPNFVSSEIVVVDDNNEFYNKSLMIRIKTGTVKGKFEFITNYNFHFKHIVVFFFSIEYIQFQSVIYRVHSKNNDFSPDENYYVGPLVKVDIGEIVEIKTSTYVNHVNPSLLDYLKTTIVASLTNSITEEINARRSLFLQSFNDA